MQLLVARQKSDYTFGNQSNSNDDDDNSRDSYGDEYPNRDLSDSMCLIEDRINHAGQKIILHNSNHILVDNIPDFYKQDEGHT
jgi:hypothetical protein